MSTFTVVFRNKSEVDIKADRAELDSDVVVFYSADEIKAIVVLAELSYYIKDQGL